jgi:predicted nucleic acid-binding protein
VPRGIGRRIVADTNQWISALICVGKPLELVELAIQAEMGLAISPNIHKETLEVLREMFGFDEVNLRKAEGFMCRCARGGEPD